MAMRASNNQWTTQNVCDSDKLKKMRVLYRSVTHPEIPDCLDGSDYYNSIQTKPAYPPDPKKPGHTIRITPENAIVFDSCHIPSGFFGHGAKRDVPKCACFVSRCGDCFVWVEPSGLDGLSRLTLLILDLATVQPPQTKTTFRKESPGESGESWEEETTTTTGGRIQYPAPSPGLQFSP